MSISFPDLTSSPAPTDMATNPSWVPDEDFQTLFSERCWLQAVVITAITHGVAFLLYVLSFCRLIKNKNRLKHKIRLRLLIFITVSFLLGTFFMIGLAAFTQMAFVDNRNYPGGPSAFETDMFSAPINQAGNVALVLSNWLSDALVIWRFKVIYQDCSVSLWKVMLFPCLLFAGSVSMGIMYLIQISTTNPYTTNGINFTLPCVSLSLGLNIILTIVIVLRLLTFRYRIVSVMGPKYGTPYTSAAAMVIESAALYSIISITFLVLLGFQNAVSRVFSQSLIQFQTIATMLIVFRVAQGKGWRQDTAMFLMSDPSELDNVQFGSPGAPVTPESSL